MIKNIDEVLTEKQRYNLLREAGYTTAEARKFRRYGIEKFAEKIEAKKKNIPNKRENVIYKDYKKNIKKAFEIIPNAPTKRRIEPRLSQNYCYVVKAIYLDLETETKETTYIRYVTDTLEKNRYKLNKKIEEILKNLEDKYKRVLLSFTIIEIIYKNKKLVR